MYLIVGVDPGTTTGIAVLDLDGRVIDLFSSKDLGIDKVIKRLIKLGRVSIIATDVSHTPGFVSKLAAQFGVKVYAPLESIQVSEKIERTRPYETSDAHQRDSLAAALLCFNRFRNRFQKSDSVNLGENVKHLVLQGYSIDESVKMLEETDDVEVVLEIQQKKEEQLSPEELSIRRLEKQNLLLKKQLDEEKYTIKKLRENIKSDKRKYLLELRRDAEIKKRDGFIESLDSSLKHMKHRLKDIEELRILWNRLSRGEIKPVGIFPEVYGGNTLIKRKLKKKDMRHLEGVEVAFTREPMNYSLLADKGILATDTAYLRETIGCIYILSCDLLKLEPKTVSVDRIIEEYRRERAV